MRLADALSADAMGEGGGEGGWERRAGAEDEGPRKTGAGVASCREGGARFVVS